MIKGDMNMKQIPLGIPLALALAGTVGSLAFGAKKVHVLCGIALTGLSLLHMYQHRRVMLMLAQKMRALPCSARALQQPAVRRP